MSCDILDKQAGNMGVKCAHSVTEVCTTGIRGCTSGIRVCTTGIRVCITGI